MTRVDYDSNADHVMAVILGGGFAGMVVAAEYLLEVSRKEAPVDDNILRPSGAVTQDLDELEVAVSYDTPYAVRQHEELTWVHPEPGTKAKYLEDPANEERDRMLEIVATHSRRAMNGG